MQQYRFAAEPRWWVDRNLNSPRPDQAHWPLPLTSGLYEGDLKNRIYPITPCWKSLPEHTDSSLLGQSSREKLLLTCGPKLSALWFCVRTEPLGWETLREAVLKAQYPFNCGLKTTQKMDKKMRRVPSCSMNRELVKPHSKTSAKVSWI